MRRSRDLYAGNKPLVKIPPGADVGTVAYEEMVHGRLKAVPRKVRSRLIDLAREND
jgi:hypothetical protein